MSGRHGSAPFCLLYWDPFCVAEESLSSRLVDVLGMPH